MEYERRRQQIAIKNEEKQRKDKEREESRQREAFMKQKEAE